MVGRRDETCGLPLQSMKDRHQAQKSQWKRRQARQALDFGLSLPASFNPSLSYAFQHQALHSVLGGPQMSENEGHPDCSGEPLATEKQY